MLCLILIATLFAATNAQYCERVINYCSICADHTMCKYPTSDFGASCRSPVYAGLMCDTEKQYILDVHNNLRRRVAKGLETMGNPGPQPPAANMRKLVWDEELAKVAQRWTNQCNFDDTSCNDVERFKIARNILSHVTVTPPANLWLPTGWANNVDIWYGSVNQFNSSNVSPYVPGNADSYTRVVWADTYTVGCGATAIFSSYGYYTKTYMCLYGPGGNIVGGNSSVYLIGPACSACPASAHACEDGLCV